MKNTKEWLKLWFSERNMIPYEYQYEVVLNGMDKIYDGPTVIAAAPGSGKTIMSIAYIERYLEKHSKSRVLVLTHGTTVLRTQYHDEIEQLKPSYTSECIESGPDLLKSKAQVVVTLPQTISRLDNLSQFDLIVVDEAHHFYLTRKDESMMNTIINKIKPKHQLLLTGTPSKFIYAGNYQIVPVSVNTIHAAGQCSDLIIEIATSNYEIKQQDYTEELSVKNKVKETQEQTDATLEDVLKKLIHRLMSIHKQTPKLYAKIVENVGYIPVLKELNKTIIACRSNVQAKQVHNYMLERGINAVLSTAKTDVDSSEIVTFKNDPDCLVLIVIVRGVLGLNLLTLENVIDMTGSQNIDRILQLMCRVIRKHPEDKPKLFVKVASMNNVDWMHDVMNATICLFDEKWLMMYNGKNFLDIKIPIGIRKNVKSTTNKKIQIKPTKSTPIDFIGKPVINFFNALYHKRDATYATVEFTSLRDCVSRLSLYDKKPNGYWNNLENCKADALKYKTRSEWKKKSSGYIAVNKRRGWMKQCCAHMIPGKNPNGYWTLERCKEDALNYKTISAWQKNSGSSYGTSLKNGWMEQCCAHMLIHRNPPGFWTLERCKEDALLYKTASEWSKKSGSAYCSAQQHKWLNECEHMKKS